MYHVAVYFDVQAERHTDFIAAALEDGRESSANEPGTQRFEVIRDETDPDRFYLNEGYDDLDAFNAHVEGPYLAKFLAEIKDYAVGPTWLIRGNRIEDGQG